MEPLRIFDKFKLDLLDTNWVNSVWNSEFTNYDNISGDSLLFIESDDMELLLRDTCETIKSWTNNENNDKSNKERSEVSWQTLCALNIDKKSLQVLLGFIITRGLKMDADEDSRQACLHATSLYLRLLAIPGSRAYDIFHENLYQSVINILQLSDHLMPTVKKKKKNIDDLESLYLNEEPLLASAKCLTQKEKKTLIEGLNVIIYNLIQMLDTWFMKDYPRSLEITIQSLIEITKLSIDSSNAIDNLVGSLSHNAFAALIKLCDKRNGEIDLTIKLILRYMLPHLLSNYTSNLPTKALNNVRDTSIIFIKKLLYDYKSNAEMGIRTLILNLMINCYDRYELRLKQAATIIKIFNVCQDSEHLYDQLMKDLILFSHNNKSTCRIFAQEIIQKFLLDPNPDVKYKKVLLATVLTRCVDSSNIVRGKAMATLAEYTDNNDNPFVNDLFQSSTLNELGLPKLEDLEISLLDDSSEILPDSKTIIGILKNRIEDERALIRRSTIQIMKNACLAKPELLYTFVELISQHCRDSAMSVRKYSISVITTLVQSFHNFNPSLYKIWVQSVVPQIFDVEVKVQEKVLNAMEDLIINNIKNKHNNLPWMILNELIFKEMKKHIINACNVWLNTGIIDDSFLSKVPLNLTSDNENDIPVWFFLSTISQSKQLNLSEYFEEYENIFTSSQTDDCYLRSLKLEVFKNSISTFDREFLTKFSQDIYNYLESLSINFSLINIVIEILHDLLKYLNESDEELGLKMTNLVLNSERILEDIIQPINQNDKINDYLKAINIMGHASLCGNKLKMSTIRILQGILIDSERILLDKKNMNELQATAVVVLGQQGVRDAQIAREIMPIFDKLLNIDSNVSNSSDNIGVKVNCVKAIADICTRFTSLVELYLPNICLTMKRGCEIIKKSIIIIFIQLLVEDYIKVKGEFFFHLLTMLSDDDYNIRQMTIFLIKERLLFKNKSLISQQFLDSIFHYNNYHLNNYSRMNSRQINNELMLSGNIKESKRYKIYDFMVENLDLPGKLVIVKKLTQVVLQNFINNHINVKEEKQYCVLKDCFYILSNDYLQPSSNLSSKSNDDDCEENLPSISDSPVKANPASTIIIEEIIKHNLHVLLPTLVEVKRKLNNYKLLIIEVDKLISKVGLEFTKEQLSTLYEKHPDLEKEVENNIRKYGKKSHKANETNHEHSNLYTPIRKKQKGLLANPLRVPQVVLRKLQFSDDSQPGPSNSTIENMNENSNSSDRDFPRIPRVVLRKLSFSSDSSHSGVSDCSLNNKKQLDSNEKETPDTANVNKTPQLYDFDFLNS